MTLILTNFTYVVLVIRFTMWANFLCLRLVLAKCYLGYMMTLKHGITFAFYSRNRLRALGRGVVHMRWLKETNHYTMFWLVQPDSFTLMPYRKRA